MSVSRNLLIGKLIRKFIWKIPFQKAKKDKQGNIVIRKPKILLILGVILSITFIVGSMAMILPNKDNIDYLNDNLTLLALGLSLGIIFLIISFIILGSKVVATTNGVTVYRFCLKKHLDYISITSVGYSALYGGSIVLKGGRAKITIPFDNSGFADFLELLKGNLGSEKCKSVSLELEVRRKK